MLKWLVVLYLFSLLPLFVRFIVGASIDIIVNANVDTSLVRARRAQKPNFRIWRAPNEPKKRIEKSFLVSSVFWWCVRMSKLIFILFYTDFAESEAICTILPLTFRPNKTDKKYVYYDFSIRFFSLVFVYVCTRFDFVFCVAGKIALTPIVVTHLNCIFFFVIRLFVKQMAVSLPFILCECVFFWIFILYFYFCSVLFVCLTPCNRML